MVVDLYVFEKGGQPQYSFEWKTTSMFLLMEDDLQKKMQPKTIKIKKMVVAPFRVT